MTPCAYCQQRPGIHKDHVVAKAMRRRHHIADNDERYHVRACASCNWIKSTRKLYPRGFDVSLLPGKLSLWREWDGSQEMLRKVVK